MPWVTGPRRLTDLWLRPEHWKPAARPSHPRPNVEILCSPPLKSTDWWAKQNKCLKLSASELWGGLWWCRTVATGNTVITSAFIIVLSPPHPHPHFSQSSLKNPFSFIYLFIPPLIQGTLHRALSWVLKRQQEEEGRQGPLCPHIPSRGFACAITCLPRSLKPIITNAFTSPFQKTYLMEKQTNKEAFPPNSHGRDSATHKE